MNIIFLNKYKIIERKNNSFSKYTWIFENRVNKIKVPFPELGNLNHEAWRWNVFYFDMHGAQTLQAVLIQWKNMIFTGQIEKNIRSMFLVKL